MQTALKRAFVHPLLKEPSLCTDTLNSYRPVGNLPNLSKVIENVATNVLNTHLFQDYPTDTYQSAHKHMIILRQHHCVCVRYWSTDQTTTSLISVCTVLSAMPHDTDFGRFLSDTAVLHFDTDFN